LNGFTTTENTSSPNNTVHASQLLVDVVSAAGDIVLQPKTTGAILAALPDSSSTGGNKRGSFAVDLQRSRTSSTQVASGNNTAIIGGKDNTATGQYSIALGYGANSIEYGGIAHSSGFFSNAGDSQTINLIFRNVTTDNTATDLFLDGSSQYVTIPQDSTWTVNAICSARRTDVDGESAGYILSFVMDRSSLANSVSLVGTVSKTVIAEDTAGWDIDVTANTTNGGPVFTVTGENAKTIRWVVYATIVQITG